MKVSPIKPNNKKGNIRPAINDENSNALLITIS